MMIDATDTHKRRGMTVMSTVPAALAALTEAQITVSRVDDVEYLVDERFTFFPANSFWRAIDGSTRGYGTRSLILAVRAEKVPA